MIITTPDTDRALAVAVAATPGAVHADWEAWVNQNIDALDLALPDSQAVFSVGLRADDIRPMCVARVPMREDHLRAVISASLRLRELEGGVGYKFRPEHVDLVERLYHENLAGGAAKFDGTAPA
jgi:hypothetical protein